MFHRESRTGFLLICMVIAFLTLFASNGFAQGAFDFSDEGTEDTSTSGTFDFTDDSALPPPAEPEFKMPDGSKPIVVTFFEPTDGTEPKRLDSLAEAVVKHLGDFEEYDAVVAVPILKKLKAMDSNARFDCVSSGDATCVSDIAKEFNVKYVIVGRIQTENIPRPHIFLDLIDVDKKAVVKTTDFDTQARLRAQEKDLMPAVYYLFDKKVADIDAILANKKATSGGSKLSTGQLVSGIVVGVAGLAAVGTGIYFGVEAKKYDDKVAKAIDANKKAEATTAGFDAVTRQTAVKKDRDKAKRNAMIANILYASGAVLSVVSVMLFLVQSDKDDDLFADSGTYVTPTFGQDGAGLAAGFSF